MSIRPKTLASGADCDIALEMPGHRIVLILVASVFTLALARLYMTSQRVAYIEQTRVEGFDGRGELVGVQGAARRVVSLAPSCTEIVAAAGALDALIGVTTFCDYPQGVAQGRQVVAGFNSPSLEMLLALDADLVVASDITTRETVNRLREGKLTVAVLTGKDLDTIASEMLLVGKLTGRQSQASAAVEAFLAEKRAIETFVSEKQASSGKRQSVLVTFGVLKTYSAGAGTYIDAAISLSGAENAAASNGLTWPQLSLEGILELDPEVLLVTTETRSPDDPWVQPADPATLEQYHRAAGWQHLRAVREGHILLLDNDLFTVPSPRILEGVRQLAEAL